MSFKPEIQPVSTINQIELAVHKAIQEQVDKAKEEIIQTVMKDFEKKIRETVGKVAITLANYYSVQTLGNELIIRVQIKQE